MKYYKAIYSAMLIFSFYTGAFSQVDSLSPKSNDIVYTEFGGNSFLWSINYERILVSQKRFQFSARIGFGVTPFNGSISANVGSGTTYQSIYPGYFLSIPIEGLFSFGKRNGKFELGLGYTHLFHSGSRPLLDNNNNPYIASISSHNPSVGLSINYRYEKPNGGFFLKAGVTGMLWMTPGNEQYPTVVYPFPVPKLCIGYKFKVCK